MDNAYVHGLRQYDNRPRSPVIVPHNLSELRKKILFENTLLEERALHEFSAGKGDGAGVDTGSAPLAPASAAAPSNIPLSQTNISLTGFSYTSNAHTDFPFNLTSRSITIPKYDSNNTTWWNPDNSSGYAVAVEFRDGEWAIRIMHTDPDVNENVATNPAPNTSIPVTGWVLEAGAGNSGSVTITAA